MHRRVRRALVLVLLASIRPPAFAHDPPLVARVAHNPVHCRIEPTALQRCAAELLHRMRAEAETAHLDRHGLRATEDEVEAVYAYDRAFRRHDRSQRTRKLAQLDQRLASDAMPASERARLESFRSILVRLAQYDADVDAGIEPPLEIPRETAIGWIEQAKLDADLHRRYGGVIGVRGSGLYAHGARAELLERHLTQRDLTLLQPDFAAAIERLRTAPPAMTHRGAAADFTPFWLRPIPASYLPD